jgi:hypothetical protein
MSGAQDITGTVTADELYIQSTSNDSTVNTIQLAPSTTTNVQGGLGVKSGGIIDVNGVNSVGLRVGGTRFVNVVSGGDISFYASDGTTQGLFWDASTQRLGLGVTNPVNKLSLPNNNYIAWKNNAGSSETIAIRANTSDGLEFLTGSTRMTITSGGNVGIGTSSPDRQLDIQGNVPAVRFTDTTVSGLHHEILGDGNSLSIEADDGDVGSGSSINFKVDGTERMRIDSSGNLTFSQEASGSPYPEQKIKWSNDSTTANGFYLSQDADRNGRVWHEQGLDVLFGTNNTERMRIDYNGNVGIGTTGPNAKLDVQTGANGVIFRYDAASTFLQIFPEDANGDISLRYRANSGSAPDLLFKNDAGTERMRITDSGNVGIGTSSPSTDLHVLTGEANPSFGSVYIKQNAATNAPTLYLHQVGQGGNSNVNQGLLIKLDGNNSGTGKAIRVISTNSNLNGGVDFDAFTVENRGHVGIGISSPTIDSSLAGTAINSSGTVLQVNNTNGATIKLTDPATGSNRGLGITLQGTDAVISNCESGYLKLGAGNAEGLRITNGNEAVRVIGTTADTGTSGGSKGFSLQTGGGTSCPLYFGSETNSAQKSMYMTGYWIYLRGHQNEGIRFVFSQGGGTAPRSDQYQFKYNSAYRPTGNTTWDGFSDERAKENVINLTNALDLISQLRPVQFDWTDDYADRMNMFEVDKSDPKSYNWTSVKDNGYDLERKTNQIGFIAQEFEQVFPKSITETEMQLGDTTVEDFKTVNYDHLIPVLTKAIQELKSENDQLKARLDAAGL